MNFVTLQRTMWWHIGRTNEADLLDWERQKVKDDLNSAFDEVMNAMQPYFWKHVKKATLSVVSGTTVYTLAADAIKPLGFWTADTRARPIRYLDPAEMDWNKDRNSNSNVSWTKHITWYEDTQTAGKSGTGSGSGISVSSGAAAVTKSGGTAFASTDTHILLNGEVLLPISAVGGDDALTLGRNYVGRLSGITAANTPGDLTDADWEIVPRRTPQIEVVPGGTESETLQYRYAYQHPVLLSDADVPLIPKKYHVLLLYGALIKNNILRDKANNDVKKLYTAGLSQMKAENDTAVAAELRLMYEAGSHSATRWPFPRDMDLLRI